MTTRRTFLASLLAASAIPTLSWADAGSPAFIAAAKDPDGSFALYGIDASGGDCFRVALPGRGHAGAAHPIRPEAVAFARRPGNFALVLDCVTGKTLASLSPPEGQYFNGHGIFSADGNTLYTVENIAETSEGRIGIWQRKGWQRIGQFASGGLGPHEMLRLPGSDDLLVANGGLLTALVTGDETQNIATMQASLAYFSPDGAPIDLLTLKPELTHNSIRHLAVRADGLVGFAMQWQGEAQENVPLVGLHQRGSEAILLQAPEPEQSLMQGYAGSIAFTPSGDRLAISSPKGGRIHLFDPAAGYLATIPRADACGLGAAGGALLATDGMGGILDLTGDTVRPLALPKRAWDNHLVPLIVG